MSDRFFVNMARRKGGKRRRRRRRNYCGCARGTCRGTSVLTLVKRALTGKKVKLRKQ